VLDGSVANDSFKEDGMSRYLRVMAMTACAPLSSATLAAGTSTPIEYAQVTGGRIKGQAADGVASFKGIAFAAPPVGALRWRVPQPVTAWSGVRAADTFAPACVQPWGEHEPTRPSEDCLYLNVWTAAASTRERRPVMVWIHGGGLVGGMSSEKVSDGTILAREGVVLVTIAYRLGALGFIAHPELTRESGKSSGNYGLFDMVAALKWVRENIEHFGGDPANVTVIGGSAGAYSISLLAASTQAKGLYARAVALGGAAFFPMTSDDPQTRYFSPTLRYAESQGVTLFRQLGVESLEAARSISADRVLKTTQDAAIRTNAIRDGEFVQGPNVERFEAGQFNDTPILIGYTSDEIGEPPPEINAASARKDLEGSPCKETHAPFIAAYPSFNDDIEARAVVRKAMRDQGLGWPVLKWARLQTDKGRHKAYVYFFDMHGPEQPHGAPHATEYPYVFGNFYHDANAEERATSSLLRQYLINFATRGDPNERGLPTWKAFEERSPEVMVLDRSSSSRPWPSLAGIKAFDAFLECFVRFDDGAG
jgi:para-nitrobenzyl esterase